MSDELRLYEVEVTWTVTVPVLAKDGREAENLAARDADPHEDTCPSANASAPIRDVGKLSDPDMAKEVPTSTLKKGDGLHGLTCAEFLKTLTPSPVDEPGFKATLDLFGGA